MSALTTTDVASDVLESMLQQAEASPEREVGGILVGHFEAHGATVVAALPAIEAEQNRAQITFTHAVWERILPLIDRDYPGERIVGWYHSHPGFGIFLSEYDKFIHKNFFSDERMLAYVVDPHSGETGWFGWRDAEIELLASTGPVNGHRARAAVAASPAQRRGVVLLSAAFAVVVAFAAGFALGAQSPAPRNDSSTTLALRAENQRLSQEGERLRSQLARLGASVRAPVPTIVYRVRPGDTLWALAQAFYGDAFQYSRIQRANPRVDASALRVGQKLHIPVDAER